MIIRCFNVGQGNSVLIELPPDKNHPETRFGVIDCFTDRSSEPRVLSYLKERGARELEFVVLTHPDADHCTGLSELLRYFSTDGRFFKTYIESIYDCETVCRINEISRGLAGKSTTTSHGEELHRIAELTAIRAMRPAAGFTYEPLGHAFQSFKIADDFEVRFFAPTYASFSRQKTALANGIEALARGDAPPKLDLNDGCLAFQLIQGNARVLICGDVTNRVWSEVIPLLSEASKKDAAINLESDFAIVTHHGSANGNPRALWDAIAHGHGKQKTVAVISCGYQNPYKHPSEKTINLILSRNVGLFCINLGHPCRSYDVMSHKKETILDKALAEIRKTPLDRALSIIGEPMPGTCSGDCSFDVDATGNVRLLSRDQDSHCAYAVARAPDFSNVYS